MSPAEILNGLSSIMIDIKKSGLLFLKNYIRSIISPCVHAMTYDRRLSGKSFNNLSCNANEFAALKLFSKCRFIFKNSLLGIYVRFLNSLRTERFYYNSSLELSMDAIRFVILPIVYE
jgi:hypothetical protein